MLSTNDDDAERQPLLRGRSRTPVTLTRTPIPKTQLTALCSVRLVDPIAYCQIFPYINEFISVLGITNNPSEVGFYSGLVESSYAVAQLFAIYPWTKLSNNIGRRPVILLGVLGVAFATMYFGISRSLTEILVSRFLAGLFAGTIAVVHSAMAEITDSTNQSVAFPIFGLFWPLGTILGPLLGGTLSDPAFKFPRHFGDTIFSKHPYLLPCLVSGSLSLCAVIFALFCLKETLPSLLPPQKEPIPPRSRSSSKFPSFQDTHITLTKIFFIPRIRALSLSSFALSFNSTAFDVLFALFCYSPVQRGGLGFSTSQIGVSLATAGIISPLIQLLFMPAILRRYDHARIYNTFIAFWPIAFGALPLLNFAARHESREAALLLWGGVLVVLAFSRIACLAYSVNMILVKEASGPNPKMLSTVNGLMQCMMCASRAISPAVVGTIFSVSSEYNLLGGFLWVVFMVFCTIVGCLVGRGIHSDSDDDDEEEDAAQEQHPPQTPSSGTCCSDSDL